MGFGRGDEMKEKTGILSCEDVKNIAPSDERMKKGPVAIIECLQSIPCDPCANVCRFGAIVKKSIIDVPRVDFAKCTGCGTCVGACPGLAVFVVNLAYSADKAMVMLPYEFELPDIGEVVAGLDREGKECGKAKVVRVKKFKDRTGVVSVAVDKNLAMAVRNIKR